MQIKSPNRKQLNVFVIGLCLILLFFARKSYKVNNITLSLILLAIDIALLIIYFIKKYFVIEFYKIWMRGVSLIGNIITGILMIMIFYLVFAPVGLFLRLLKKDLLNLRKDLKLRTYWIDKPQKQFDKSSYEKQF